MDAQVENAIQIAWDPASDQNLKSQAFDFLNRLRHDASAWQVCLPLFTRQPPTQEVVRHFALEILNNAIQAQQLDAQSLAYVRENVMSYIRQTYAPGRTLDEVDTAHIQNKLTQTVTYLFTSLYGAGWESFFDDFRSLAGDESRIATDNVAATMLYLRILGSVHEEIADVLIPRSAEEQARSTELKDLVRVRDAEKIAASWQEILGKWRQAPLSIVEICLKTVSRWVSWMDISLIVNQAMLNILFELAGQQGMATADSVEGRVRNAAIDTFTEIVNKKMKPTDKVELIRFLSLATVVAQLATSAPLAEFRSTSNYDTDLAETVAKLVNAAMVDIVKVMDAEGGIDARLLEQADEQLHLFIPHLLRFFADEYDEICSTVIPSLTDLLSYFRKIVKVKGTLPANYQLMLGPILTAIIGKMKYDETASWGAEDDQTDEAEFQELRRRLHILQQTVAVIDEALYMDTLSEIVANTFNKVGPGGESINWRDLDLALHEMYLLGELAVKNGGLYAKKEPSSLASQRLIEMMSKMVESDLASFPHPAVQLQFMEICVRYSAFFEQNQRFVPTVLESFVRFVHSEHVKVRTRSWYLFLRFVKPLRAYFGNVATTVIDAIRDLMVIKAELPEDAGDDDMSSDENDQSSDGVFDSQLFLFEAAGTVSSHQSVPTETKVQNARTVMEPLFTDFSQHLEPAKNGDERAILQIHHIITALGHLARGFSDWMPGTNSGDAGAPPDALSQEFARAAEATLLALDSLKSVLSIRSAARSAFTRMVGVLGSRVLGQLPQWIDGLLSQSSSKDEMATFLRMLDQVVFGFKGEIFGILDELLSPLVQRVFAGLSEPTTGTDDEIQLAELRREYLNFLMVILNNELGSVLVSSANQSTFDSIISTIEHFARDLSDYPTARLAFIVLARMVAVWGGPNVALPSSLTANGSATATPSRQPAASHSTNQETSTTPQPTLPGFDSFAISRFSPLTWEVPSAAGFNAKDPQARQVLAEAAALQLEILRKTGPTYLDTVRTDLHNMGVGDSTAHEYVASLVAGWDREKEKEFRGFFQRFVAR